MALKLHAKKKIDLYAGALLLIVVDLLALALGFILRRKHSIKPVHTIVVMKFQGMGSLILAKPALNHLRKTYPRAKIIFWGTPATATLAREMPEFNEVVVLNDKGLLKSVMTLASSLFHLWKQKPDWVFDLEVYSKLSSVLATMTCARNRIGFAVDTVRHRRFAHTHLVFFNRYEYLGKAYARLIGLLFDRGFSDELILSDFGHWKFSLDRPTAAPSGKYIVLNIHAGELCFERKWPREYFERLIDRFLQDHPDYQVALIGYGKLEIDETNLVKANACAKVVNLAGKLTLQQTVALLAGAKLVISNDSAPLHFALTTAVPVLGLFGPTRPQSYFPLTRPKSVAITQSLYCSPCVHHWEPPPCRGDNQCMKTMSVERVIKAVYELLGFDDGAALQVGPQNESRDYYPGLVYERKNLFS